ncbi:hypothetical protein BaRGS_00027077 [Batillaria attramentaria]|uniref:Uncharacterized protein n=1 Tax=Batillaria attramentaria TaxID=370345 RepID=A0ABD0K385_9CAEN
MEPETETALIDRQRVPEPVAKAGHVITDRSGTDDDVVRMQGNLGIVSGIALIVGTIIGSGIFISLKGMLEGCGSIGLTLIIWVACGALSTMGALVYAELGSAIPKPTMFAVLSMALGTYTVKPFFPTCDPPPVLVKLVTAVAMCLIAFLNCLSVKVATRVQVVCTVTKLLALVIIALGGLVVLGRGDTENLQEPFAETSTSAASVAIAFYNGLWAFDGWNSLNFVTEELKNPSRNLPLAIMVGIPLTTVCYVLANVGYFAVMSKGEIIASHAVAVRWGDLMLGPMSWLMPVFVIVSTFGAANGVLFVSGRLSYAAGREGHFPKVLGYLNMKKLTPVPAILFTLSIAICLIIPSDLGILIDIFIFSSWLFYGLTTLSLLVLRYTQPHLKRPYKVRNLLICGVI